VGPIRHHRRKSLDMGRQVLLAGRATKTGTSTAFWHCPNDICRGVEKMFEVHPQARSANRFARTVIRPPTRVDSTGDLHRAAKSGSKLPRCSGSFPASRPTEFTSKSALNIFAEETQEEQDCANRISYSYRDLK
jgi:hypothetical protein